jgi:hypothetical protein
MLRRERLHPPSDPPILLIVSSVEAVKFRILSKKSIKARKS